MFTKPTKKNELSFKYTRVEIYEDFTDEKVSLAYDFNHDNSQVNLNLAKGLVGELPVYLGNFLQGNTLVFRCALK